MTDQSSTGSADASGDSGLPDYKAKYDGLQSAFQRRQNEWAAKETAWAEERETLAAKADKVAEYEAREATERADAEAQAEYERLRERFENEPPAPQNPNATNLSAQTGWDERYARKDADTAPKSTGWPT